MNGSEKRRQLPQNGDRSRLIVNEDPSFAAWRDFAP
jgi:hypothetical protein